MVHKAAAKGKDNSVVLAPNLDSEGLVYGQRCESQEGLVRGAISDTAMRPVVIVLLNSASTGHQRLQRVLGSAAMRKARTGATKAGMACPRQEHRQECLCHEKRAARENGFTTHPREGPAYIANLGYN